MRGSRGPMLHIITGRVPPSQSPNYNTETGEGAVLASSLPGSRWSADMSPHVTPRTDKANVNINWIHDGSFGALLAKWPLYCLVCIDFARFDFLFNFFFGAKI